MPFRQRVVKGFVVDGDNNPIIQGKVGFKPNVPIGFTATHVVVDRPFTTVTDENGFFSIDIWCDEDSSIAIDWVITFPITNTGNPDPSHSKTFSLSYEDGSPIDVGYLMATTAPSPDATTILQALNIFLPSYVLSGIVFSNDNPITSSDNILSAFGKLQAQNSGKLSKNQNLGDLENREEALDNLGFVRDGIGTALLADDFSYRSIDNILESANVTTESYVEEKLSELRIDIIEEGNDTWLQSVSDDSAPVLGGNLLLNNHQLLGQIETSELVLDGGLL